MRGYSNTSKNSVLFTESCDFRAVFYVCTNVFSFLCAVKIEVQRKVSAAEGKSFNWRCTVEGLPKPNVYWADAKRNEIREGTRFITRFAEELRIQNVRMGDSGRYYCVAYRNETRESKWTELRMDVYGK